MFKLLKDILPTLTSHGVGHKRVLLGKEETESSITQVAVTTMLLAKWHRNICTPLWKNVSSF